MFSFITTSILLIFFYYIPISTNPSTIFRPILTSNNVLLKPQNTNSSYPVTFAYLLSASKGDSHKLKRVLLALYHPNNHYLIHMDREAPPHEQAEIAQFVANEPVFSLVNNVYIVSKPNLVTYRGPTMLSTTLHAVSMLLRCCNWDWFINLSASDYPLVTQDGMVSALLLVLLSICSDSLHLLLFYSLGFCFRSDLCVF